MSKRRIEMLGIQNVGPIMLTMFHPGPQDPAGP